MSLLEGIKVVEFTTRAAGSVCGRILADRKADVIKVEPIGGEAFRAWEACPGAPTQEDENPLFELGNANKRGLAIDATTEDGKKIMFRLLERADVFLTNYSEKELAGLRLDRDTLSERYPRLICGYLSEYGSKGEPAAMSGFRSIDFWSKGGFGGFFGEPGAPPVTPLPGMGEQVAGTYLAGGIAAALIGRELTGRGEVVETSLLHSALWSAGLFNATSNYWDNPKKSRHAPDTPLINCFEAKDGAWFCLSIMEYERHWPILCACVGHPELIDSERYSTLRNARTHSAELTALLDEIFAEKNREEWLERFEKADLPAGPIYDAHDILRDRQAFANDYIRPVSFRNGHQAFLPTPPCRFEETGESEWRHAPRIGAHTAEILAELNYTEAEINALIAGKAVGGR